VLLVPHHGSKTSSTPEFMAAVGAAEVLIPVGYRNRFGHPKPEVLERYTAKGSRIWRTDRDGALRLMLGTDRSVTPLAWRAQHKRYWHGR
jgi:competence protein ComEC